MQENASSLMSVSRSSLGNCHHVSGSGKNSQWVIKLTGESLMRATMFTESQSLCTTRYSQSQRDEQSQRRSLADAPASSYLQSYRHQ